MSWETIITIGLGIISLLSAPYLYVWRTTMQRVDTMDTELKSKVSKDDLKERLTPISDDIKEIQSRLDKVLAHLLSK